MVRPPIGRNELWRFGPAPGMRFDPHPLPVGEHDRDGVTYLADTAEGTLLEVFHRTRTIDRGTTRPRLYASRLGRQVTVLDLRSAWSSRARLEQLVHGAPISESQQLARQIAVAHPALDGILYRSARHGTTMNAAPWWPATDALHSATLFSAVDLSDPALTGWIEDLARRHGYAIQ